MSNECLIDFNSYIQYCKFCFTFQGAIGQIGHPGVPGAQGDKVFVKTLLFNAFVSRSLSSLADVKIRENLISFLNPELFHEDFILRYLKK